MQVGTSDWRLRVAQRLLRGHLIKGLAAGRGWVHGGGGGGVCARDV